MIMVLVGKRLPFGKHFNHLVQRGDIATALLRQLVVLLEMRSLLSGKLFTQKTPRIAPIVVFCSNRVAL